MNVPMLDLCAQYATIREQVEQQILRVCATQAFILGSEVSSLEREVAEFCGVDFAVGVSSGTDALLVSLLAAGIEPGDEVITSPYSFFATAGSMLRLGARPIFVDIEPDTFNLNAVAAVAAISPRTRAIVPVHLFGRCAEMGPLLRAAEERGIAIIEDAAQAIGARDQYGRRAGSIGDTGCFSFFPSKNLGGFGDGGMVVTRRSELDARIRILRVHGSRPKHRHVMLGGNFRLDALQAAVLRVKLPRLQAWSAARRQNAERYRTLFAQAGPTEAVTLPADSAGHVYNQFVVRAQERDALREHLERQRIGTEVYYPTPIHLQPCVEHLGYAPGDFPHAEQAARETLALPVYPELTADQQSYVVEQIASFYRDAGGMDASTRRVGDERMPPAFDEQGAISPHQSMTTEASGAMIPGRPRSAGRTGTLRGASVLFATAVFGTACSGVETTSSLLPPPVQPPASTHAFPVGISANGRFLVDDQGKPFFIHAEAAWSMLTQLPREKVELYLEDRYQKGINAIIANLIESTYTAKPPANAQGHRPFRTPGDFTTPNEDYFADIDWALAKAAENGFVVLLNPAYMGFRGRNIDTDTDGWWSELEKNGPVAARWYGRWLGNRYREFPNIIWVAGGDRIPPPDEDGTKNFLELLKGIKDEAPADLWTAHWNGNSVRFNPAAAQSLDVALFRPYMDLNGIYTYEDRGGFVHEQMLEAYRRSDFKPAFLWEAHYEGPNHFGYVTPPEMVRRQAYESVLTGGTGHVSGSMFIWSFGFPVAGNDAYAWEQNLDSPGMLDMGRLRMLILDRAWYELVPDTDHELITSGYGTKGTGTYITAAATPNGRLALAYVSSTGTASRSFTVALRRLTGPITARWYNPTNGRYTTVAGSPVSGGEQTFVTPGDNGSGTNDWILVLETIAG